MIDPEIRSETSDASVPDRVVRQFGALGALLLGGLAARDFFARADAVRGSWLALAAVTVVVAGWLRPGTIRPVFTAAMAITTPIRIVVSNVLLGVMYYGIFTPLALLFRLIGRDALARRRRAGAATYWVPKPRPADMKSYFRQS